MKVISLLQPWASLIALGEKKIETRSWTTKYRGPLLIHASKSLRCSNMAWTEPFYTALRPLHRTIDGRPSIRYPIGVIIAKCNLVDCVKIQYQDCTHIGNGILVEGTERCFGDYTIGRYAWMLEDIEMLVEPIPVKGQLGLWDYPYEV